MYKVVIVEDEDLVARMYERALSFEGFTVITANGGKEGYEKIVAEKPDLVLLDIMMPEPSGIKVLEYLQANTETKGIPIVMLTNLSGIHDKELALLKGASDYWVKKDVQPGLLGKRIKSVIEAIKSPSQPSTPQDGTPDQKPTQ